MASSRLDYGDEQMEKRSFTAQLNKPATTKKSNYGSLRKELSTQQTASAFIVNYRHRLVPGETLQGISLKYGIPMENIKRANRLWSNDLAFIKDFLLIPIDREKLKEMNLVIEEDEPKLVNLNDIDVSKTAATAKDPAEDKEAYKDFLNKFDSFINESKLKLKSLESSSNLSANDYLNNNGYHTYVADDEDDTDLFDVKRHLSSKEIDYDPNEPLVAAKANNNGNSSNSLSKNRKGNSNQASSSASSVASANTAMKYSGGSNSNSSNNLASLPDLIVKSPNSSIHSNTSGGGGGGGAGGQNGKYMSLNTNSSSRARMAQETLERLEKEKDDLFEL